MDNKKKSNCNIILKWTDRIICDIFLGAFGVLMLIGIWKLIALIHTPPPDIADLITLLSMLLPVAIFIFAGIIAGLVYHGRATIKEVKEAAK